METRDDLLYSRDHMWVKAGDGRATIGITEYGQRALGDIVQIELPEIGSQLTAGAVVSLAETAKAIVELYSPLSGLVAVVNHELQDRPEIVSEHPYEQWIAICEISDPGELDTLMDEQAYRAFCAEEALPET